LRIIRRDILEIEREWWIIERDFYGKERGFWFIGRELADIT
jgi:hypothetical protein